MEMKEILLLISHISFLISTFILCLIGKRMVGVINVMVKEVWSLRGFIASHKDSGFEELREGGITRSTSISDDTNGKFSSKNQRPELSNCEPGSRI